MWQATGTTDIRTNQFVEKPEEFKAPLVAMQKARSPQCFDHGFYRDANFFQGWTDELLWHHFVHSGQFEAKPHRCRFHLSTLPHLGIPRQQFKHQYPQSCRYTGCLQRSIYRAR